eukprot:9524697-Prorocentrum_lima.AAC.1
MEAVTMDLQSNTQAADTQLRTLSDRISALERHVSSSASGTPVPSSASSSRSKLGRPQRARHMRI